MGSVNSLPSQKRSTTKHNGRPFFSGKQFVFTPLSAYLRHQGQKLLLKNTSFTPSIKNQTARVLKDSLPTILSAVTNLVNTFARAWKLAEVIPLVKSGDADESSNTRPISLLPIMSKILERAGHSQFVNFLDQNEKIAKLQNGNRQLHSTETALLFLTDEILKNMDDKKVSVIVLLDMSKVFYSMSQSDAVKTL